jgi:hypothetical protein
VTDHRALQRTLFRMQADADFASALLAGERDAVASTGLAGSDLELLDGVDPAALRADPGAKRRIQIAGNAASEFTLSLAAAGARPESAGLLDGFLGAPEFHRAMAAGTPLPLAFGAYGMRRADELDSPDLGALVRLETAMARLRRDARAGLEPRPPAGAVQLSARAAVVSLPGGTLEGSLALRDAVEGDGAATGVEVDGDATETLLLCASAPPHRHALPQVDVELLLPPADALLARASEPLSPAERADYARAHGAEPADLERFLDGFVADGVLARGGASMR